LAAGLKNFDRINLSELGATGKRTADGMVMRPDVLKKVVAARPLHTPGNGAVLNQPASGLECCTLCENWPGSRTFPRSAEARLMARAGSGDTCWSHEMHAGRGICRVEVNCFAEAACCLRVACRQGTTLDEVGELGLVGA
jgi:hypothetical protein